MDNKNAETSPVEMNQEELAEAQGGAVLPSLNLDFRNLLLPKLRIPGQAFVDVTVCGGGC